MIPVPWEGFPDTAALASPADVEPVFVTTRPPGKENLLLYHRLLFRATLGTLALVAGLAPSVNAATLNVVDGILVGASNVDVAGDLYDVMFVDGSCATLFNGCDDPFDFDFTTHVSAELATQALFDQVFLDGGAGFFDSNPHLTAGCTGTTAECRVYVPYRLEPQIFSGVFAAYAENQQALNQIAAYTPNPLGLDQTGGAGFNGLYDWTASQNRVLSKWAIVPEPGAATLLVVGLIVMGTTTRSRA
jgi:hypothetical protein